MERAVGHGAPFIGAGFCRQHDGANVNERTTAVVDKDLADAGAHGAVVVANRRAITGNAVWVSCRDISTEVLDATWSRQSSTIPLTGSWKWGT